MRKAIFIALLAASSAAFARPYMSADRMQAPYTDERPHAVLMFGMDGGNLMCIRNVAGAVSCVASKEVITERQNFPAIPYGESKTTNWTTDYEIPCRIDAGGATYSAPYWHSVIVRSKISDDILSVPHGNDAYDLFEIHMECTAGLRQ